MCIYIYIHIYIYIYNSGPAFGAELAVGQAHGHDGGAGPLCY